MNKTYFVSSFSLVLDVHNLDKSVITSAQAFLTYQVFSIHFLFVMVIENTK